MKRHVYTNKNYVLRTIKSKLDELGDWKYFNILIIAKLSSHRALSPTSYNELVEMLSDYDKVYSFHEVESLRHGEVAYDIVLE